MRAEASIARKYARAKADPLGSAIAAAARLGVRFRDAGADLELAGTEGLAGEDLELLERLKPGMAARLKEPPGADVVGQLDVTVRVIADADEARRVVEALPDLLGLDIETAPADEAERGGWINVKKTSGERAVNQPDPGDAGLDPHRARVRLVSVYDPDAEAVYVFDLFRVPIEALGGLWGRRTIAHNATFELAMLRDLPRRPLCSQQLAGLRFGRGKNRTALATVARFVLGIELPKALQVSDWAAPALSGPQVEYAAADAVVCQRAFMRMWGELKDDRRAVFKLQNASVRIAAVMRVRGVAFDPDVHRPSVERWETEHAEATKRFIELEGREPPKAGEQLAAWLEARLTPAELLGWRRTATGRLGTSKDDLDGLEELPALLPLLDVYDAEKRLNNFGRTLIERISPVTGRLHPDWKPCAAKTGRWSCSTPNLQQLPKEARAPVIAPEGRTLVVADYSQIELRVLAELAGEDVMRSAFADGRDIHTLTAASIARVRPEDVTPDQRKSAKAFNFGLAFGMGAPRMVVYAWRSYRVRMTEQEAASKRAAWFRTFPAVSRWHDERKRVAGGTAPMFTALGRPLYPSWETGKAFGFSMACSFPVQGSAADVMLTALPRVVRALKGLDAFLILQVHDELVVECAEDASSDVAAIMEREMVAAFAAVFPGAPTTGLVSIGAHRCWGDAK